MTARTTRYATPSLTKRPGETRWTVWAANHLVGWVYPSGRAGCTAVTRTNAYAGLYPDKQAAAEALVKQAGFELLHAGVEWKVS